MRHAPALFQSRGANACADSETRARVSEVQVVAPVRWNASPQVTDRQGRRLMAIVIWVMGRDYGEVEVA